MKIAFIKRLIALKRSGALTTVLLLSSMCVIAQAPASPPTSGSTQQTKLGSITGRVVNENGEPLANARILLRSINWQVDRGTITDRDGRFEITSLEPLIYHVYAVLAAYTALPREGDNTEPDYYRISDSLTIVLTKGGVITGTVTTATGEPLVGVPVRVRLLDEDNPQPWPFSLIVPERQTDDRGVYRIYGLPSGTYIVLAGGGGSLNSGPDAYDRDVPTYSPSSTRDTAGEITVVAGQETSNVDIRYRGERGQVVSGRSTPAGPGVISLTSVGDATSRGQMTAHQHPEAEGFIFYGVEDGDYDLAAHSFTGPGERAFSASKRIRVRGADVTGIELITAPAAAIDGRVVLEELQKNKCTANRSPVFAETFVFALPKDKIRDPFAAFFGTAAHADPQGNIAVKNLRPGQYHFDVQFSANSWYLKSISLTKANASSGAKTQSIKPTDAAKTWTTVKSGDRLTGLSIILAEGAAALRGQIVLAEGETLPEKLTVYLTPAERESADDSLRFYASPVSRKGKFALDNLAPGRYWLLVQPQMDEVSPALAELRSPDGTEKRARLRREAEAAKKEIELKSCRIVVDFHLPWQPAAQ